MLGSQPIGSLVRAIGRALGSGGREDRRSPLFARLTIGPPISRGVVFETWRGEPIIKAALIVAHAKAGIVARHTIEGPPLMHPLRRGAAAAIQRSSLREKP